MQIELTEQEQQQQQAEELFELVAQGVETEMPEPPPEYWDNFEAEELRACQEVWALVYQLETLEQTHPDHYWMALAIAMEAQLWFTTIDQGLEAAVDAAVRNLGEEFPEVATIDLGIKEDVEAAWDAQDAFFDASMEALFK